MPSMNSISRIGHQAKPGYWAQFAHSPMEPQGALTGVSWLGVGSAPNGALKARRGDERRYKLAIIGRVDGYLGVDGTNKGEIK